MTGGQSKRGQITIAAHEEVSFADENNEDRRRGLPRSNYSGDWVTQIAGMSQVARDRILGHPAIATKRRDHG